MSPAGATFRRATCPHCKQSFVPTAAKQRYCDRKCSRAFQRVRYKDRKRKGTVNPPQQYTDEEVSRLRSDPEYWPEGRSKAAVYRWCWAHGIPHRHPYQKRPSGAQNRARDLRRHQDRVRAAPVVGYEEIKKLVPRGPRHDDVVCEAYLMLMEHNISVEEAVARAKKSVGRFEDFSYKTTGYIDGFHT